MSQLFPLWPTRALMKTGACSGWSLIFGSGYVNIILRRGCACGITCLSAGRILKYSRWNRLITVLYICFCRLSGRTMSAFFIFVPTFIVFTYLSGLYHHGNSDDIQWVITLALSKLIVLAAVKFLLCAAYGAAPDYFVRCLRFDDVGGGMLFWLPSHLVHVPHHFGFSKITERMRMDSVLAMLAFHQTVTID